MFGVIFALHRTVLVKHFSLSMYWCFLIQLYAIAILPFGWYVVFFVMRINYNFHVGHTTVAYFNVVFIELLLKFVCRRKNLLINFRN